MENPLLSVLCTESLKKKILPVVFVGGVITLGLEVDNEDNHQPIRPSGISHSHMKMGPEACDTFFIMIKAWPINVIAWVLINKQGLWSRFEPNYKSIYGECTIKRNKKAKQFTETFEWNIWGGRISKKIAAKHAQKLSQRCDKTVQLSFPKWIQTLCSSMKWASPVFPPELAALMALYSRSCHLKIYF